MEKPYVLYENREGVVFLTLNRPEVRNALSPEMWQALYEAVMRAEKDETAKVVVVTGSGEKV